MQAAHRLLQSRPPWTVHLPTGRACGQPLRGSLPAHRSSADAFGLTRAEADLALALQAGGSPTGYARERTLSLNTVYTHLRRLKEKTGATRLSELIGRLNELRLPLR